MNIEYKLKIREVPQKKTVYVGSLNKSSAIIKIFINKQDFVKELKGVLLLISASVKTPRILLHGKQKENEGNTQGEQKKTEETVYVLKTCTYKARVAQEVYVQEMSCAGWGAQK